MLWIANHKNFDARMIVCGSLALAMPQRYNLFCDSCGKMDGESSDCQPWKARRGVIVSFSWKPEIAERELEICHSHP